MVKVGGSRIYFQNYLVPQIGIFDDKWHNMRLYGEIMLILLAGIVAVGVKLVSTLIRIR